MGLKAGKSLNNISNRRRPLWFRFFGISSQQDATFVSAFIVTHDFSAKDDEVMEHDPHHMKAICNNASVGKPFSTRER